MSKFYELHRIVFWNLYSAFDRTSYSKALSA